MSSKVTLNDRGVITIPAQLRQAYGRRDFGALMGQPIHGVEVVAPVRLAQLLAARRGRSK